MIEHLDVRIDGTGRWSSSPSFLGAEPYGLTALFPAPQRPDGEAGRNRGRADIMMFRTASGSLYTFNGKVLSRMSERPVAGLHPAPAPADALAPIEVGRPARFLTQGAVLHTSAVVEVMVSATPCGHPSQLPDDVDEPTPQDQRPATQTTLPASGRGVDVVRPSWPLPPPAGDVRRLRRRPSSPSFLGAEPCGLTATVGRRSPVRASPGQIRDTNGAVAHLGDVGLLGPPLHPTHRSPP